ncbi:MAG TPA: Hpt domain-containing protein [Xanthobacteraceae bacterium]|jgi:HPt (histidine-containing phosphotransfer) domain-containing protein|nr:Hpt domain-containing protein [Xanthobacteraceae bacterium]
MAQGKSDTASVATYADHEVITPPNDLRKAVTRATSVDDDPIARAEKALDELSDEFSTWMNNECERLDQARRRVHETGLQGDARERLFHAAHDIKGEAATFGYPFAAAVAESLCRLIEHTPDLKRVPLTLVDQHVDAVRAITREHAAPDAEKVASELAQRLRQVTDEFLLEENKHRLDELDGVLGPPLAPEATGE